MPYALMPWALISPATCGRGSIREAKYDYRATSHERRATILLSTFAPPETAI